MRGGYRFGGGDGCGSKLQRYSVDDEKTELLTLDYDVTVTEWMVRVSCGFVLISWVKSDACDFGAVGAFFYLTVTESRRRGTDTSSPKGRHS